MNICLAVEPYAFRQALTLHNVCWLGTGCKALTTCQFDLPSIANESGPLNFEQGKHRASRCERRELS